MFPPPDIMSGFNGESSSSIRDLFDYLEENNASLMLTNQMLAFLHHNEKSLLEATQVQHLIKDMEETIRGLKKMRDSMPALTYNTLKGLIQQQQKLVEYSAIATNHTLRWFEQGYQSDGSYLFFISSFSGYCSLLKYSCFYLSKFMTDVFLPLASEKTNNNQEEISNAQKLTYFKSIVFRIQDKVNSIFDDAALAVYAESSQSELLNYMNNIRNKMDSLFNNVNVTVPVPETFQIDSFFKAVGEFATVFMEFVLFIKERTKRSSKIVDNLFMQKIQHATALTKELTEILPFKTA
ncbi:hypothetical protein O9G_003700 [Rozella allomycis CSF55]|uniref:Uncharacterized protein n=1 Tax=Rozella allomycis (strain CSF55) TaxID=988480 RepID=A0A075AWM7_ROZAC|nr:hypothetical protein O9G_003700 [Rozella allomycis CSF55]|eukprot:EPZ32969.1 hypothetical protein O9G_003700 [Rozella allomycis CSF55]